MRFIHCVLCYLFSASFHIPVFCQDTRVIPGADYPKFNLRTSLTSFFEYDGGLTLGLGYRWSKTLSASFEPGLIFYKGLTPEDPRTKTYPFGVKIRADLKVFPFTRRNNDLGFFIAPEFHYKLVGTKMEGNFGINCSSGQCPFFQRAWYTEKKNEIGGLLKLGSIFPLLRLDRRWLLEFYAGLGFKYRKFSYSDIPTGASPPVRGRSMWFGIDPEDAVPLLPAGVKLFFLLEKKE